MDAERKLYILGHPIGHSKSPVMYNALYERMGLPWRYGSMDVPTSEEAARFIEARDFLQINITTPYKPEAYRLAEAQAATARLARGANVLVNKAGTLVAYNVDGLGCVSYLRRENVAFDGARIVVCGTGPTALSIMHAAATAGAAEIAMLGRDRERARRVVDGYLDELHGLAHAAVRLPAARDGWRMLDETYDRTAFKFGAYDTARGALEAADLIVDATPLGMCAGDPAPFDTALLHAGQTVFDTVYGHGETALLHAAREAGARAFDGAGMLVAQAVETAGIVCDIEGVPLAMTFDEMFALMAHAAGFTFGD